MKKINAFCLTAIMAASISAGQFSLSGTIKSYYFNSPVASSFITLRPESPTAKADSMNSDANGRYSFPDVWPGVYTVLVNHTDYLTDSLYVAIEYEMVADFELLKKANVYLIDIPDTLKKAFSPIIAGKTMAVNHSLFIEPGVTMILLGDMTIKGEKVTAIGRKNDSIMITSRGENISLNILAPIQTYRFCSIKTMSYLNIYPDTALVQSTTTGIQRTFDSCNFSDINVSLNNYDEYGAPRTTKVVLQDCYSINGTIALQCDTLLCKRNILITPISGRIESKAIIANNDIYSDFSLDLASAIDTIKNNILSSVSIQKTPDGFMVFAFNNVMQLNTTFPGIGNTIIRNDNGEPCDLFFNIYSDPQTMDMPTGALFSTSPCIRAGQNGTTIGVWQGNFTAIAPDKYRNPRLSAAGARSDYSLSMQVRRGRTSNLQAPASVYSLNGRRLSVPTNSSNRVGSANLSARATGAYVLEMRFSGKR